MFSVRSCFSKSSTPTSSVSCRDIKENFVARLLGHKLKGMSFGRYSKLKKQKEFVEKLREIVESVQLPI
jgi:hypothetical protein